MRYPMPIAKKKATFVDPFKVTGSPEQIAKTLLKLKSKDFPDDSKALDIIRRLKVDADQGEMRLIAYLVAYERSELWKKSAVQCHTFDGWLKYYQTALPDVRRYNSGKTALLEFGVEACVVYGIKPLSKVVSLPKAHRRNFIKEELEPGVETRKFPLSEVTVSSRVSVYRKSHGLVNKVPRVSKSDTSTQLSDAKEEIIRLRDEVRVLTTERNDLLKRLAKYEKLSKKAA
jgi:hypothetical protein